MKRRVKKLSEEEKREGKKGRNIPSLRKYCQKENDRKNETEIDNSMENKGRTKGI